MIPTFVRRSLGDKMSSKSKARASRDDIEKITDYSSQHSILVQGYYIILFID